MKKKSKNKSFYIRKVRNESKSAAYECGFQTIDLNLQQFDINSNKRMIRCVMFPREVNLKKLKLKLARKQKFRNNEKKKQK